MRTENGYSYIYVGGEERKFQVKYKDVAGFIKGFHNIVSKIKSGPIVIPNDYFFKVLYKCMVTTGWLFWKKPFRSSKHMENALLYDELQDITQFISKHILKFEDDATPKSKKKEPRVSQ